MLRRLVTLTTGRALLLLDIATIVVVWPLSFLLALDGTALAAEDAWAAFLLYSAADLVALFALGLYRRDVGIELRKSLARIPVVAVACAGAAGGFLTLAACRSEFASVFACLG